VQFARIPAGIKMIECIPVLCGKMLHIKCFDKNKKIVLIKCPCGRKQNYDRIRNSYPQCQICSTISENLFRTDQCSHYFCKICYERITKDLNLEGKLACIDATCKQYLGETDVKEILPEKLLSLKNNSKYKKIPLPNLHPNEIEDLKMFSLSQKNETLVFCNEEWASNAEVWIMANDEFFTKFQKKLDKKMQKHQIKQQITILSQ